MLEIVEVYRYARPEAFDVDIKWSLCWCVSFIELALLPCCQQAKLNAIEGYVKACRLLCCSRPSRSLSLLLWLSCCQATVNQVARLSTNWLLIYMYAAFVIVVLAASAICVAYRCSLHVLALKNLIYAVQAANKPIALAKSFIPLS